MALGGAVLVLLAVVVQALTAGPGPTTTVLTGPAPAPDAAPAPGNAQGGVPAAPAAAERIHPGILETAARQAPFSPDREGPSARYRLPEDRVAERPPPPPAPDPEPPAVPAFQLLGAVSGNTDDQGWVILSVVGEEPTLLAVGESLHGYRVVQVVGSSAMLTGSAGNFRVTVADPSPSGPSVAVTAEGQAGARRNPAQEARDQAVQQREVQQRAMEIARQLQQQMGGEGQVRIEGDRVILTSPDGRDVRIQRVTPTPGQRMQFTPPTPARRPPGGGDR
ncbi:MAG: hypothetical protein EA350_06105 [Gemmatimonadales bacterium]|nr:MAG: hypothetical protein EA350_06105 [Gemmatimonadales bacterium]